MQNDISVIRRIEKSIGKKLEKMPLEDINRFINGYALDDGGRVKGLTINGCQLTDISSLQSLTQLKKLFLSYNRLSNIAALKSLTQLTRLALTGNQLSDISVLQSLRQLKELWLDCNKQARRYFRTSVFNAVGDVKA
ncbi:MAG: leucine-rich repeat domain-containing protein [bacterium]|nr:leucine-rich repeat domain-containing protein [bacterium]